MSTSITTTPTARTDRCSSTRPQGPLPRPAEPPFGRYDETASVAWYTSICRSHDVTEFSAPTRCGQQLSAERASPALPLQGPGGPGLAVISLPVLIHPHGARPGRVEL